MKRFALALSAFLIAGSIAVAQQPDWEVTGAPPSWTLSDAPYPTMFLMSTPDQKTVFELRQDGVFELGEGQTPKSAAEFFLANMPHDCPDFAVPNAEYLANVFEFRDTNKGTMWSISVDYRGHVNYTGLDYVGPNLAEFMNFVASATKCE